MPHEACPYPETLRQLCEGRLAADHETTVSQHIGTCKSCQAAIDRLGAGEGGTSWLGAPAAPQHDSDALRQRLDQLKDEVSAGAGKREESFTDLTPWLDTGRQIGRVEEFELLECIGRGGMGVVFRAADEDLHRTVAIKFLSPSLLADSSAAERFLREARAAARVIHPHVVTVHSVSEIRGLPYLVMEFVRGQSLGQRLAGGRPLPIDLIMAVAKQTAAALAAAHAAGVIHRDIKPANILLQAKTDHVKLSDFGLARSLENSPLTQSGLLLGTPEYMAPEQVQGAPVDHRSDLFSLGSVMYTMCCGVEPFSGPSIMSTLNQVCMNAPEPIQQLNPGTPNWLVDLIGRLQAKDPHDRPNSALAVVDAIEQGQASANANRSPLIVPSINTHTDDQRNRRTPTRSRLSPWISIGSVCGVVLMLIAFAALYPGRDGASSRQTETNSTGGIKTADAQSVAESETRGEIGEAAYASTAEEFLSLIEESDEDIEIVLTSSEPYHLTPFEMEGRDIRITAARGITPTLNCTVDSPEAALLFSEADVYLNGVILRVARENDHEAEGDEDDESYDDPLIRCEGGSFTAVRCRFRGLGDASILGLTECGGVFDACELLTGEAAAIHWYPESDDELAISNSVIIAETGVSIDDLVLGTIQLHRNTFFGQTAFEIVADEEANCRLNVTAKANQFDARESLFTIHDFTSKCHLDWDGEGNLLPNVLASLLNDDQAESLRIDNIADWREQFGVSVVDSRQQIPGYLQDRDGLFELLSESDLVGRDLAHQDTGSTQASIGADLSAAGPVAD